MVNLNDSGAGSLRQVIADACAGSTISFQPGVTTVSLTSAELVGNYAIKIVFSDGHSTGIYRWKQLLANRPAKATA